MSVCPPYRLIFFSVRHATGHVTKLGQASGQNCYGVKVLVKESCLPRGSSEDCTKSCAGRKITKTSAAATCVALTTSDVSRNNYLQ